jgi:hypothetical protein
MSHALKAKSFVTNLLPEACFSPDDLWALQVQMVIWKNQQRQKWEKEQGGEETHICTRAHADGLGAIRATKG